MSDHNVALRAEALITAKHYGIQSSAVHFSSKLEWMSHRGVLMLRQVSLHRNPISVTLYIDAMRSCFGETKLQARAMFVLAECAATLASLTIVESEPETIEPEPESETIEPEPEPETIEPEPEPPKLEIKPEPLKPPEPEMVVVEPEPKPEPKAVIQAMVTRAASLLPPLAPPPAPFDAAKLGSVISSELSACMMKMMEMQAKMTREIIAEMHDADRTNISMIVDAITAPKRIVHDEDGHPIGVEVGAA